MESPVSPSPYGEPLERVLRLLNTFVGLLDSLNTSMGLEEVAQLVVERLQENGCYWAVWILLYVGLPILRTTLSPEQEEGSGR